MPDWAAKALEKARREAQALRVRLRRTELVTKYGQDVVELIDEDLPLKKQMSLAEKFAAKLAEAKPAPDEGTEKASEEEPTPEEERLAAVTKGVPSGTQTTGSMSREELDELYRSNPAEAVRLLNAGLVRWKNLPEGA